MITGRVRDCGCIALPEEFEEQTGLYPGATYRIELTANRQILLIPIAPQAKPDPKIGARCG